MRSARWVICQTTQRCLIFVLENRTAILKEPFFELEEVTCKILIKRLYQTDFAYKKYGNNGLKIQVFMDEEDKWFTPQMQWESVRTYLLLVENWRFFNIHSREILYRHCWGCIVSFSARSFITYISLLFFFFPILLIVRRTPYNKCNHD